MSKGMRYALVAHGVGVAMAVVVAWFLPHALVPLGISQSPELYQWPLVALAVIWGAWMFVRILAGKDRKANKLINFYDADKPTVKS